MAAPFSFFAQLAACLPLASAVLFTFATHALAQDQRFQELMNQLPRSANVAVILNMEKLKQSPMGVREGWANKIEKAFESGLFRVPPQATRFVLAADLDFEFMEPSWEAAIMDVNAEISMEQIAAKRGSVVDTIDGFSAVGLPDDTYAVQFGPRTLGAIGPGKRQAVARWIRELRDTSNKPLPDYLDKLASYSDKAGSDIIMGMDLDNVLSLNHVVEQLKAKQHLLDEWKANLPALAKLLSGVRGVRVGVRIGEELSGRMVVDVRGDASIAQTYAKPLLLTVLAERGMSIADLETWTADAKGNEISLAGSFSKDGLRRLLSLIDSPAPQHAAAPAPDQGQGDSPANRAKASLDHFHAVTAMADDLKKDMKDAKSVGVFALYFDKYAKKIGKLPILNVDEELLKYSAFVANQLRNASGSVRGAGIRTDMRQSQITSSAAGYGYVGGYRYGAYGVYGGVREVYSPRAEARGITSDRLAVGAEERGNMALNVHQIRDAIAAATADIRRKMTLKYQVEF